MASITYETAGHETPGSSRGIGERPGAGRPEIPERLLWKLWKRRASRQAEFRSDSGSRIRVLYPGRPGTSAGPDFRDALLDVEGIGLVRGDVEIHRRQRDWDAHGHGDDPNYSGVVVHGVLEVDSPETELQSGTSAQVVSLSGLMDEYGAAEAADTGDHAGAGELWELLAQRGYNRPGGIEEAGALLDRAGDERFRRRAALLGRFASEQGAEQALYEALMEGLGYRQNQQPFVRLAQAAPVAALQRASQPVLTQQRPMVLRHWLLTVSGLNDGSSGALPDGLGPAMERGDWHLFRVRPANHPAVRIGGAAELLARFLAEGLIPGLARAAETPKQLTAALTVEGANERAGAHRRSAGAGPGGQRRSSVAALPGRGRGVALSGHLPRVPQTPGQ